MEERNHLKEEATKTGSSRKYDEYKRVRNKVTAKLRSAKDDYFREKFNDPDSTPKDIWKTTYQVLGSNRSNFPSQILINGKLESKPINMAEGMNNFFLAKIFKIKSSSVVIDDLNSFKKLNLFLQSKIIPEDGFALKEINVQEDTGTINR